MLYRGIHHFIFTISGLDVAARHTNMSLVRMFEVVQRRVRNTSCRAVHGGRIFLSGSHLHITTMEKCSTPVLKTICRFKLLTRKFCTDVRSSVRFSFCEDSCGIPTITRRVLACSRVSIPLLSYSIDNDLVAPFDDCPTRRIVLGCA